MHGPPEIHLHVVIREQRELRWDAARLALDDDCGRQRLAAEAEFLRLGESSTITFGIPAKYVSPCVTPATWKLVPFRSRRSPRASPRLASTTAARDREPLTRCPHAAPAVTPITFTLRTLGVVVVARTIATGSARTTPAERRTSSARAAANGVGAGEGAEAAAGDQPGVAVERGDGAPDLVVEARAHAREEQRQREDEPGRHDGDGEAAAAPLEVT